MKTTIRSRLLLLMGVLGVVIFCGVDRVAAQFTSSNVTQHSWLDLNELSAASGNDCWGYVSPSGREYALMGLESKVAFVEVTDPANANWFDSVPHTASLWGDIKVYQDHAYAVTEAFGTGIQVIDMSNIDAGFVSLVQTIPSPGRSQNLAVDSDSGFLYTCGSNEGSATTVIFDLSDPANPVEVGTWADAYLHDAQIVTYTSGPYAGRQIMFGASEGRGLDIIDVTDKSNTFLVSRTAYANVAYCHQVWTEDLRYLYVNDEADSISRTTVFDISSLELPVHLGDFNSGTDAIDHNLYVVDSIIYEANHHGGLRIFGGYVDPISPPQVAWFDTYPEDDGDGFDGAWSVYPFFPSGTVVVSDMDRGLFVLGVDVLAFSYPAGLPVVVPPDMPTMLTVHIDNIGAPADPATVTLHAGVDGGPKIPVTMSDLGGNDFEAPLPSADCGSDIEFYVSSENTLGTEFLDPPGAPGDAYRAFVVSSVDEVFADDFEQDNGWVTLAETCSGATSAGAWERVDPNGTPLYVPEDDNSDPGTFCFVTEQGVPGGGDGAADVDGGPFTLISPTVTTGELDAVIRYARWFACNESGPEEDFLTVEISGNGGGSWTSIETVSSGTMRWVEQEVRLSDIMNPGPSVTVRFSVEDCPNNSVTEAAIDDFSISVLVCETTAVVPFEAKVKMPLKLRVSSPAGREAHIVFDTESSAAATVRFLDVTGRHRLVKHLGILVAGIHDIGVDVSTLPAGVYFVSVSAGHSTEVSKLVIAH